MSAQNHQHDQTNNGPLYVLVDRTLRTVQLISPVEWKKSAAIKLANAITADEKRRVANIAIDIFIACKWAVVLSVWVFGLKHWLFATSVTFLLIMNLHTYFWYHLWVIETRTLPSVHEYRERRRFINLIQAGAFSVVAYAYLYHQALHTDFVWPSHIPEWLSALIFSIGNALTGFAGDLKPETPLAQITTVSQLLMTFTFVAMLLSNSVPRTRT